MDRRRRQRLQALCSHPYRLIAVLLALGAAIAARAEDFVPRSGLEFTTPGLRVLQADDFANPALLWVADGNDQWSAVDSKAGKSCASCHGPIASMRGVQFPRRDERGLLMNLETRIERCRTEQMGATPLGFESRGMIALTAAIRSQSRGLPQSIAEDRAAIEQGERYFRERRGWFNLSCAQCHEQNVGKHLRDEFISQAQINGFPTYRARFEEMFSVHRRFQACNETIGAEPEPLGSQTYIALEWYLTSRGSGLPIETPSVRQ
jgi:sulfur-oxidizing protein SoxA